MKKPVLSPFDTLIAFLSFLSLLFAILLATVYVNKNNPIEVPFLLRPDTYDKVLPFLLGTVAVGGFALAYNRAQRSKDRALEKRRVAKATLEVRIHRLQDLYETVLDCFQNIRLQRRCLRESFVPGQKENTWKIRRGVFENVSKALSEAQLSGERVIKTLDFEQDALRGETITTGPEIERLKKLQIDLRSQIGGIQGVLRNVLRTSEWKGITQGTSSDEDLIDVPDGLVKFADSREKGNLGFRKIGEHFDAFAVNIIKRIHELEEEVISFSQQIS